MSHSSQTVAWPMPPWRKKIGGGEEVVADLMAVGFGSHTRSSMGPSGVDTDVRFMCAGRGRWMGCCWVQFRVNWVRIGSMRNIFAGVGEFVSLGVGLVG